MEKNILSKSTYIKAMQCQKQLFLYKKKYFLRDPMPPERAAKFQRGHKIGFLAQQLFPNGMDCSPKSPSQYRKTVQKTKELIQNGETEVIYEAGFQAEKTLILLDILVQAKDGWEAYEVKSSLGISDTYIQDAALQNYVIQKSGLNLKRFYLVHLNPEYRMRGELKLDDLFVKVDVNEEITKAMEDVAKGIQESILTTTLSTEPQIPIGKHCYHPYDCDFIGHCWSHEPKPGIYNLPMLSLDEKEKLKKLGKSLTELLEIENINRKVKNQIASWQQGKSFIDKERIKQSGIFGERRRTHIIKPLYYRSAKPRFEGDAPYQEHLFAYGIVTIRKKPNGTIAKRMDVNIADCDLESLQKFKATFDRIVQEDRPLFFEHESELALINIFKEGMYVHPNMENSYDLHQAVKIFNPSWEANRDCPSDTIAAYKFMEILDDDSVETDNVRLIENYLNEELTLLSDLYLYLADLIKEY